MSDTRLTEPSLLAGGYTICNCCLTRADLKTADASGDLRLELCTAGKLSTRTSRIVLDTGFLSTLSPEEDASLSARGMHGLHRLLDVVGVRSWSALPGKYIRVATRDGRSLSVIGNITQDEWLDLDSDFGPDEALLQERLAKERITDPCSMTFTLNLSELKGENPFSNPTSISKQDDRQEAEAHPAPEEPRAKQSGEEAEHRDDDADAPSAAEVRSYARMLCRELREANMHLGFWLPAMLAEKFGGILYVDPARDYLFWVRTGAHSFWRYDGADGADGGILSSSFARTLIPWSAFRLQNPHIADHIRHHRILHNG